MRFSRIPILHFALLVMALMLTVPYGTAAAADLQVSIHGPGQKKVNIFLAPALSLTEDNATPTPRLADELYAAVKRNLDFLPFVHRIPSGDILGGERVGGVKAGDLDFKRFAMGKVDYLFTFGFRRRARDRLQIELRVFRTRSAELFVGRGFVVGSSRQSLVAAKRFCATFMEELTGASGFFHSRLAFVRIQDQGKDIGTATPQGDSLKTVVQGQRHLMSPAWSWDGQRIAYVRLARDGHELKVWNKEDDSVRRVRLPGNTIISPAYHPDGRLAVSIDPEGNPDIYFLEEDGLGQPVVQNWAIDITPGFDSSGRWMSFVSSRLGNPHVFLKDLENNSVERISYEGDYNTSAAVSPSGQYIAYSRLTEEGHRIFIHDRLRETTRQLTHGPGNDEDPAWGPDGYFLAFASNRSGEYRIYIGSRHGDGVKEVETGSGEAKAPDWSPELR
jgi:TolB protein